MKSTATSKHGHNTPEPVRSRAGNPSRSNSSSGYLGQLAATINSSPRVQAQVRLAQEMQGGARVRAQHISAGNEHAAAGLDHAAGMGTLAAQMHAETPQPAFDILPGAESTVQRKKIINVGSGTSAATLMRPQNNNNNNNEEEDEVVNVDSGHMRLAEILLEKPGIFFNQLAERAQLEINQAALESKIQGLGEAEALQIRKQFLIRALFEKFPGQDGFIQMFRVLDGIRVIDGLGKSIQGKSIQYWWRNEMYFLEEEQNFKQGFVSGLGDMMLDLADEVHAISALGFDLIRNEEDIQGVVRALKPGGKLIITAEKTGMVSKAIKMKKNVPIIENGIPVLKEGLKVLTYFDYVPDESSYGSYGEVFEANYPGMETSHTTGGGFEGNVPFARLVFTLKDGAKDLAPTEWEQPHGLFNFFVLSSPGVD
jgi:hypothetical protein